MDNEDQTVSIPPNSQLTPIGIFQGVRNESGHYLFIETYGNSVILKIHQDDKLACFQISPEKMPTTIQDITDSLKKCCDRVRSDYAIDT